MFGYINVNKETLKQEEYEYYRSFYCGLCHSLKKHYGQLSRLSLSYDLCFIGLLLTQVYEEDESKQVKKACLLHPLQKHLVSENEYIDYACDMSIVLTYYKCVDNYKDEHSFTSKLYGEALKKAFNKVKSKYPHKVNKIKAILDEYDALEAKNETDIDELAKLTGMMMEEVILYQEDHYSKYLKGMAHYLGRFIYILDAYDDLEKDRKKKRFNPFYELSKQKDFNEQVKKMLEIMIAESVDYFDYLPIINHNELLQNILYSGIWSKFEMIYQQRTGDKNGSL